MVGPYRWHIFHEQTKKRFQALIKKLGGRCVVCKKKKKVQFRFHHKNGKSWRSRSIGPSQRLKRYEQEAENGEIELMCKDCYENPKKHSVDCFCPWCREKSDF